jgi:hypothetical protein
VEAYFYNHQTALIFARNRLLRRWCFTRRMLPVRLHTAIVVVPSTGRYLCRCTPRPQVLLSRRQIEYWHLVEAPSGPCAESGGPRERGAGAGGMVAREEAIVQHLISDWFPVLVSSAGSKGAIEKPTQTRLSMSYRITDQRSVCHRSSVYRPLFLYPIPAKRRTVHKDTDNLASRAYKNP